MFLESDMGIIFNTGEMSRGNRGTKGRNKIKLHEGYIYLIIYFSLHLNGYFSLLLMQFEHEVLFAVQCYGCTALYYRD